MGRRARSLSEVQVSDDEDKIAKLPSPEERRFGRHVKGLRRARGATQEILAARSGLSADTIRRLEHGCISPSLETLFKLCRGLSLSLSTFFESFEFGGDSDLIRELSDLLATRTAHEIKLASRVIQVLFTDLDDMRARAQVVEAGEQQESTEGSACSPEHTLLG